MKLKNFKFPITSSQLLTTIKLYWPIVLLTFIGAILRLYNFRSTLMFLGDQARDADIVRHFVKTLDPIIVGPTTSVGKIQLGPFYYYFMAPFLLLSNFDPIGPALAVAFIGIITIPILYSVSLKMFDRTTALIASILFTFSNVIIANTRFSWNPNPMPFVIILLIYFIYKVYQQKKYKSLIGVFITFAIALQLHYMALMLSPALAILGFLVIKDLAKKDQNFFQKYLLLGLLAFFLFQVPLIIFDLMKGFLNTRGFLEFFQKGHHTSKAFQLIPRFSQRMKESLAMIIGLDPKSNLAYIFSLLNLICSIIYVKLHRQQKSVQILFFSYFCSFLALIVYSGDLFEHYIAFLFPISILLIACCLSFLSQKKILLKIFSTVIIAFIIFQNLSNYRWKKSLGWTIDNSKYLSSEIAKDVNLDTKSFNIVLLDETRDYRAMQYRYFLTDAGVRNYDDFDVDIVYLISQWDYRQLKDIELRELEQFFGLPLMKMTTKENTEFLESKIIKEWKFSNGPFVYKLVK